MAKANVVSWDCWDERLPGKDVSIVWEPPGLQKVAGFPTWKSDYFFQGALYGYAARALA